MGTKKLLEKRSEAEKKLLEVAKENRAKDDQARSERGQTADEGGTSLKAQTVATKRVNKNKKERRKIRKNTRRKITRRESRNAGGITVVVNVQ